MQLHLRRIVRVILAVSMSLSVTGWASAPGSEDARASGSPAAVDGIASYYGKEHHGKKTANGEIFDMYKLTAAHRSLPFGSQVKVTNLANNRSVLVRINDRGPYIQGRIIDLSQAAAERLDMIEVGIVRVKLEVLDAKGSPKKEISSPSETPGKARFATSGR